MLKFQPSKNHVISVVTGLATLAAISVCWFVPPLLHKHAYDTWLLVPFFLSIQGSIMLTIFGSDNPTRFTTLNWIWRGNLLALCVVLAILPFYFSCIMGFMFHLLTFSLMVVSGLKCTDRAESLIN